MYCIRKDQSECIWNKMKHVPKQIISILHTFMNQTKQKKYGKSKTQIIFLLSQLQASILTNIVLYL
jgi:hypothetical protein